MSNKQKLGVKNIVGLGGVREVRVNATSGHEWDVQLVVETDTGWVGPISVRPVGYLYDKEFSWMDQRETARRHRDLVVLAMLGGDEVLVMTERGIESLDPKAFGFKAKTPKQYRILHRRNGNKKGLMATTPGGV